MNTCDDCDCGKSSMLPDKSGRAAAGSAPSYARHWLFVLPGEPHEWHARPASPDDAPKGAKVTAVRRRRGPRRWSGRH